MQLPYQPLLLSLFLCVFGWSFLHAQSFDKAYIHRFQQHKLDRIQRKGQLNRKVENISKDYNFSDPTKSADLDVNITQTEMPEAELHAAVNPTDTNNIIVAGMYFDGSVPLGTTNVTFPIFYTSDCGQTWQQSAFNGDLGGAFLSRGGGDPVIAFDNNGVAYLSFLLIDLTATLGLDTRLHWATSLDGGATWELQDRPIAESSTGGLFGEGDLFLFDKEWIVADQSDSPFQNSVYATYTRINPLDTTYQIYFNRKLPGVDTFEAPVVLTSDTIVFAQFTSLDVDAAGNIHVLFSAGGAFTEVLGLYYVRSEDGGQTFSSELRIADVQVPFISPGQQDSTVLGIDPNRMYPCPHLRVDRTDGPNSGNIYLTWTANGQQTILGNGLDIYFTRSTDNGTTWETPRILNDDGLSDSDQFFSSLTVNENGVVALSWYDRRNDSGNASADYYMTYSTDGGTSFTDDLKVTMSPTDFQTVGLRNDNLGVGEYMQVVSTPGFIIPFWSDGRDGNGNLEIYQAKINLNEEQTTGLFERRPLLSNLNFQALFPNPAQEFITVSFEARNTSNVEILVTDGAGQVIRQFPPKIYSSGTHQETINLEGLPTATYFCVLRSGRRLLSRVFAKGN